MTYKQIAATLDRNEVENFYQTHLPKDVCSKFGFSYNQFKKIFEYLAIPIRTAAENTVVQFQYYDNTERNKKVGRKGREISADTRAKISKSLKGRSFPGRTNSGQFKKGNIPYSKGKRGEWKLSKESQLKRQESRKRNCPTKQQTGAEKRVYKKLLEYFSPEDIIYRYSGDIRYNKAECDFYIPSRDIFIEVHAWWHHGEHPFDAANPEDVALINYWQTREAENPQYREAIYNWTVRDKQKLEIALTNNLKYILIYNNLTLTYNL